MDHKKILAGAMALTLASLFTGCESKNNNNNSSEPNSEVTTSAEQDVPAEKTTEEELEQPMPIVASDINAITFDNPDFSFASVVPDDEDSAKGELEIAEVFGNKMLRFKDSGKNFADGTVQKIKIDAAKILSPENVAKVRSIELDVYADATASDYENEDGEKLKAPGWIGGGGGANVAGDKWYQFGEWSGGEYNFEMSGAAHAEFKFLLADSGQCWDDTMEEAVFLVMRWGAQNEGNMYIDNIVFYDKDGNSLPPEIATKAEKTETEGKTEELPDGGQKIVMPDGETHVYTADGIEDLDQYVPGTTSATEATTTPPNGRVYDSDGNEIVGR